MPTLEGVAMELDDCSFPTLQDIVLTDDPNKAFKDCNWALLVGSFPRKQGMERKDLLMANAEIFSAYVPGPKGPVFMSLIERAFGRDITTRTLDTVRKCAFA